jgi:hypothetical protein
MNELLSNKERKKERKIVNPKGPHNGASTPTRNLGIPIPQVDEWAAILQDYRKLAAQEASSLAHVVRSALIEYHARHMPGNPAVPLTHWTDGQPLSPAAKEKLAPVVVADKVSYELRCRACSRFFTSDTEGDLCPRCAVKT